MHQKSILLRRLLMIGVVAVGAISLSAMMPPLARSQSQGFSFALIGDLGYVPSEEAAFANVLTDIGKDAALSFVVHVGDLSSPLRGCTNDMQDKRLAQFNAMPQPVIYTPGDNEWTDCHEGQNVKGYQPFERLERLRTLFFAGDESLGKRKIPLIRQSGNAGFAKYRENVRWDQGGVTFVTLHVVGSNDGFGRTPEGDAEHAERTKANVAWLEQAFAHARSANSRAVMVMLQANIYHEWQPAPKPTVPNAFEAVRLSLVKEAAAFEKPVMLVHGDTHYFRLDNPLWQPRGKGKSPPPSLENFTRLELFGSPNHHWVQVSVDPNDPNVFTVRPRNVPANVVKRD